MIARGKWLLWMRAFLHSAAIGGVVIIAASWFVAAYISSVEREKAIEEAMHQSDSLVRLFEHNTIDTLARFDRTLLLLRKVYEDDPAHFDLLKWADQSALSRHQACNSPSRNGMARTAYSPRLCRAVTTTVAKTSR